MVRKSLLLALCITATPAVADELPSHIVHQIKMTVRGAQAIGVAKVLDATLKTPNGSVQLAIETRVMGTRPGAIEVPETGFDRGDLVPGTRLLVAFTPRADGGWMTTGRYELISEGMIREIPEHDYLARTTEMVGKLPQQKPVHASRLNRSGRSQKAASTVRTPSAKSVGAPTKAPAPARSVVLQQPQPPKT
ncbi:MAG: hypothetical protein ACT4TC_09915 [Myxococcaceae bacterium]